LPLSIDPFTITTMVRRLPLQQRRLGLGLGLLIMTGLLPQVSSAADPVAKTVWDGVYTDTQAQRGQSAYAWNCGRCHGEDLTGSGNVLRGGKFMDRWREDSVKSLFNAIKSTMPRGAPGSLGDGEYLDIVAFILQANAFPTGADELTIDSIERTLIVGKEGPKPVPDFALITVSGCLVQGSADTWLVKNASEPARTRNPRESTETELAAANAKPSGKHEFRLLDIRNFPAVARTGRWVEAKGLLIRAPGDDRINLTWLQTLAENCKHPQ
jgi:mono/diheme cytochrome c family protein